MLQPPPERQIHRLMSDGTVTLAAAESCTGGLVSYRVTSVAGSSAYFLGGLVTYTNELKHQLLGVRRETLESYGAVSDACAREMAEGVRKVTGATIGVSTTGIAGPGGATARKPVGLIYIACATADGTECHEVRWRGDRATNMKDATEYALNMVVHAAERLRGVVE
jgi:PncC family amidohydrolase